MATVNLDPAEYPSNSNSSKKEEVRKKKKKKPVVTSAEVTVEKPSLARKFKDAFIKEDIHVVIDTVIHENIIPAIIDAISDAAQGFIDGLLYGSLGGGRRRRSGSRSRDKGEPSYAAYYKSDGRSVRRSRSDDDYESESDLDFRDYTMPTRAQADEVLGDLMDYIEEYQEATVADYLDLIDKPSDPQDNKWGWTNLSRAQVKRVRNRYTIDFPRVIYLD